MQNQTTSKENKKEAIQLIPEFITVFWMVMMFGLTVYSVHVLKDDISWLGGCVGFVFGLAVFLCIRVRKLEKIIEKFNKVSK